MSAHYTLRADAKTVHRGTFDSKIPAVLKIEFW